MSEILQVQELADRWGRQPIGSTGSAANSNSQLRARQRFIKASRPNSHGCVERLQLTILEEAGGPLSPARSSPR
jgi:hypothetical protein